MEKDITKNLENKKKYLFLSISSVCLKYCKNGILRIPSDGSDIENLMKSCVDYKIILGKNHIVLTSFEGSGFFDERYDLTFVFGTHHLLTCDYIVYDDDGLKKIEMSNMSHLMKKVVRRKGKFEYTNELLIEEVELNDAAGVIYYTKEGLKNFKAAGLEKKIKIFDLIKKRIESLKLYDDFDRKIKTGTLNEYEWG